MKTILSGWSIIRFIRLLLGVAIIIQGIISAEWLLIAGGVLVSLLPVFNIGCCTGGSCGIRPSRKKDIEINDVTYEEVK